MKKRSGHWIRVALAASLILGLLSIHVGQVAAEVDQDGGIITKHVLTPDYTIDDRGVQVPGYSQILTPGAPELPLHGFYLEVPLTGELEVSYDLAGSRLLDQGVDIPSAPVPNWPTDEFESADERPTMVPVIEQPDPAIYSTDAFYPASPVAWDEAFRNGDKRLLPIRVYPFQYNPVTRELRYHPDVRITVRVNTEAASSQGSAPETDPVFQPTNSPSYPANVAGAARVHTLERGMYRLTHSDLGNIVQGFGPDTFAVYYEGQPVDIKVTGAEDGSFDAGDLVIFYAVPYTKRWQQHNVYWFTWGGTPSPQMVQRMATVTGNEPVVTTLTQTFRHEYQRIYIANAGYEPNLPPLRGADDDHWLGERFPVNSSTTPIITTPIDLSGLDDFLTTGTIEFRAQLHRATRLPLCNPDNSLEISLNSHYIGRYQWNGESDIEKSVNETLSASWLDGSPTNQMVFQAAVAQLAPCVTVYNSLIDWFEITYTALADAEGNNIYLESVPAGAKKVEITGFTTNDVDSVSVYDISDPRHPVELMTKQFVSAASPYTLNFWDADLPDPDNDNTTYQVSLDSDLVLSAPLLVQTDTPSTTTIANLRSRTNSADYIALLPSLAQHGQLAVDLETAVDPLLDYRGTVAGGDYDVARVSVQDVFDEFGYGRNEPIAIREFLAYAYWNWNDGNLPRPQFVLFVGDSTTDTEGYIATTPMRNLMPANLGLYDHFAGEVPSDNRYVSVDLDGTNHLDPDDHTPNMAAGRIPAQNLTQLNNAVNKTLNYENGTLAPPGWQSRVGFAAGNCTDEAGNLHDASRYIATALPASGYQQTLVYYGTTTSTIPYCAGSAGSGGAFDLSARGVFNSGAVYFQWVGHGSWWGWSNGPSFDATDIDAMAPNSVWPLTAHYACATGDFSHLENDTSAKQTFGEDFVIRSPDKGSVVDYSGSGQHLVSSVRPLGYGTVDAIFRLRIERAGKAIDVGKMYYLANNGGSFDDVVDTMILFGDPATRLRLPAPLSGSYTFVGTPDWVPPGQAATFNLELINSDPEPATGRQVTLTLPDELGDPLWMTSTVSSPVYSATTREITWTGTIDGGQTITISFASEVSSTLTACGLVTVAGQIYDTVAQVTTPISASVNLTVPDVNCSSAVDIADIQSVSARWGMTQADPDFHPRYDLNSDGAISVLDIAIAAQAWEPVLVN